jgi:hypothetical protein
MTPTRRARLASVAGLIIILAAGSLAAACTTDDDKGLGDSPVRQAPDIEVPAWPSPDSFMNIAARCIGPNGVYLHTRAAAPVVIPNDPNCERGALLHETRTDSLDNFEGVDSVEQG